MLQSPLKRIRQGKIYVVGGSADGRTLNTFEVRGIQGPQTIKNIETS